MAIYVTHPHEPRLLIVPNKTASMYVEIQADFRTVARSACDPSWPATLIVRDPVSWYVSGFRHVNNANWQRTHSSYGRWATGDFAQHLETCLQRRYEASTGTIDDITPWDFHSWMNPVYQAQGLYYGLSTDQNHEHRAALNVVTTVKLEDSMLFNRTVQDFTAKQQLDAEHHNQNWGDSYPELSDLCAGLLNQLDDWSHSVGYDLNTSIAQYRKERRWDANLL